MPNVIRAWKDPSYRATLSAEELAALPAHPAGESWPTLQENELRGIVGGAASSGNLVAARPSVMTSLTSCGYVCTATTECPILSICCAIEVQ